MFAAPLIMSADLRSIRPEFKEIMLNRNLIKLNQDPLGVQAKRIIQGKDIDVYSRPIMPAYNGKTSSCGVPEQVERRNATEDKIQPERPGTGPPWRIPSIRYIHRLQGWDIQTFRHVHQQRQPNQHPPGQVQHPPPCCCTWSGR